MIINTGARKKTVHTRFIIGADGSLSSIAKFDKKLSRNTKFLVGYEKVFLGRIRSERVPLQTMYHFWLGEFSLGYGGWISPYKTNGETGFRIGYATQPKLSQSIQRLNKFIDMAQKSGYIQVKELVSQYSGHIPIGGLIKRYYHDDILLIGDAMGACGSLAGDGIKGAVATGITAAKLVNKYFQTGAGRVFNRFYKELNKFDNLRTYLLKQRLYRVVWDMMKSNRTYECLFSMLEKQKSHFVKEFSGAKSKGKGMHKLILRFDNTLYICRFVLYLAIDMFKRKQ